MDDATNFSAAEPAESESGSPLHRRRPGTAAASPRTSLLAHGLLLAGATAAVFLAAGPPQGALGIFLLCAGVALTLCPPQVRVGGRLWLAASGTVACASLALLPAHWFPVPAWREALESLPVIPSLTRVTPVPWQTAFWLALLGGTALTILFMLAQPLGSRMLLFLVLAAALACGAYAALAVYAKVTGWHYPYEGGATFGFFPNRNHTATFLITGGVLSMGVLGVTLRDRHWIAAGLAAGSLSICVVSLFLYSSSRGGVVFLLVGTVLWLVGLGQTHRHGRLVVSCVTLLLAGGAFFVVSGGEAQSRIAAFFKHPSSAAAPPATDAPAGSDPAGEISSDSGEMPLDGRILIYKDTLSLIRAFPLTGTGLGSFAAVFPQYRRASLTEAPAVHPESDWLMLLAEAGIPAFLCVVTLVWLLAQRLPALKEHPYWPLRWGCVAAAGAAVLHGSVDVPVHHVSLGWWIMAIAGLGLQPGRIKTPPRSRAQHAVFVLGGVAMLIMGIQLIRAEWCGAPPLPPFAIDRARTDIALAYEHHDIEGAIRLDREAIRASPWDELLYHQWGAFEVPFADSDAEVDGAFAAERLLDPGSSVVPLRQGEAWLRYDSVRPVALWLDALSRRQRIDRAAGLGPDASVGFYRDLLGRASKFPAVQRGLMLAANERPAFALAWLESARPELVREQLARLSTEESFLRSLHAEERRRFLMTWYATGDRGTLKQFIDGHDDWQKVAWPIRVKQWIDAQEFERAIREVTEHYQVSLALPVRSQETDASGAPDREQADPAAAFTTYWRNGNTVAARRVLDEATSDATRPVPPEVWRLKAADAAQKSDWAAAWQSLRQYIRADRGETL